AFFSDAYHAEWCYPKLRMVKEILGQILLERVASGWYDEETALSLPRQLFFENPKRVYGV
ncbi:MAG: glucuronate isomerase, partial [Armatimonadota bacterium]|nr:glucuronate isomerase [Armatimonadota bacterium]